jgi:hypothetical protein
LGKIYGSQWRSWGKDFKQVPNENGDGIYDKTITYNVKTIETYE